MYLAAFCATDPDSESKSPTIHLFAAEPAPHQKCTLMPVMYAVAIEVPLTGLIANRPLELS